MKFRSIAVFAVTLAVLGLSTPSAGAHCASFGNEFDERSVVLTDFLPSPDGRTVVWSLIFREFSRERVDAFWPELVWTRFMMRDRRTGREVVLAESRFRRDGLVPIGEESWPETDDNHQVCAMEWSPSGRELLVYEVIGPLFSDAEDRRYWIVDREARTWRRIDLRPLIEAVEAEWRRSGRQREELEWAPHIAGWFDSRSLLVPVWSLLDDPRKPLGFWLISASATSEPRPFEHGGAGISPAVWLHRMVDQTVTQAARDLSASSGSRRRD